MFNKCTLKKWIETIRNFLKKSNSRLVYLNLAGTGIITIEHILIQRKRYRLTCEDG